MAVQWATDSIGLEVRLLPYASADHPFVGNTWASSLYVESHSSFCMYYQMLCALVGGAVAGSGAGGRSAACVAEWAFARP